MHLEFCHPEYQTPIVTSRIQEVRERIHRALEDSSSTPLSTTQPMPMEPTPALSLFIGGTFTKPS
jgi:hypothetical protein